MTVTRRAAATLAAATLITLSLTAAAGGCGSSSASTGTDAPAPGGPPGEIINNVCTANTTIPAAGHPGPGVVGGYVKVTCTQTPDILDLDVDLNFSPEANAPEESEIVDTCYQYEPADLGNKCVVASSCKQGYWTITWKLSVDIDGAPATSSDSTHYHAMITKADCAAVAA